MLYTPGGSTLWLWLGGRQEIGTFGIKLSVTWQRSIMEFTNNKKEDRCIIQCNASTTVSDNDVSSTMLVQMWRWHKQHSERLSVHAVQLVSQSLVICSLLQLRYLDLSMAQIPLLRDLVYSMLRPAATNHKLIIRDHRLPRNAEFWAEPWNFPVSAEFLSFRRRSWNSALAGDKGTNMAYFRWVQAAVEN